MSEAPHRSVRSFRLSDDEYQALKRLAEREDRGVSGQVRVLIAEATKREEKQ